MKSYFRKISGAVVGGVFFSVSCAHAVPIVNWVDMSSLTVGSPGAMSGQVSTSDGVVEVAYDGTVLSNSVLNGYGYWGNGSEAAYIVDGISYAPPTPYESQMIMFTGGFDNMNTVHFSQTIENPVMALRSLGGGLSPVEMVFGATFEILSQGENNGLSILIDSVLQGVNGDGLIRFAGLFDSLSWVVNGVEAGGGWSGFSIGFEKIADISSQPDDPAVSVPEPPSLALLLLGVVGISLAMRGGASTKTPASTNASTKTPILSLTGG